MNLSVMTREQLEAMVAKFQASSQRKVTLRVSKSGGCSLYGLGRYPVTLYPKGWNALLDAKEEIVAFLEANADLFSTGKDDPRFPKGE